MSILAVQGAIGGAGRKPLTEITGYNFDSIAEINGSVIGAKSDGIHNLNTGETLNGIEYIRSFTINQTDFGVSGNLKKLRYVYISMLGAMPTFTLSARADEREWKSYCRCVPHGRGVRVSVGSREKGVYWSFKVSSKEYFRIDSVEIMFMVMPAGISQC
jgi:hypothetical protein